MKKQTIRVLSMLLVLTTLLSSFVISVSALSWDGSSQGGGGNTTSAGPNGYAIRTDGDNCIGYRFSVVDKSGSNKVSKVIDVFRNTSYGNMEYTNAYKFTTKYNKKQLINNQNAGFSTSKNTTNCYKEADCGFATSLPAPSGMGTWQNNTTNLNKVLSLLNAGNIAGLKNGDKILVEPIYDVRLESVYHALTVTEIAIYGKHILGTSSNGGSSATPASWGFISNYTNRYYPNELFTPDGQGLWTGVSAASSRLTFYDIINKGYGVGIAYTETKPDFTPALSVKLCEAWPGSKSVRNNNHYGISYGNSFANWTYGHGYPKNGDTVWFALNFPAESENCYVKQTVWIDGGGSVSRNVWSNSNTWYDVQLDPKTVAEGRSYYTVKARVDWINSSGTVLKYGAEKSFYIPVQPTLHRYQVTMYCYAGTEMAHNGSAGLSGKVYVGQKVKAKYTFTTDNTWTSYDDLWAAMHKWSSSGWIRCTPDIVNGTDLALSKKAMSKTSPVNAYSTLGYVRVPDNSGSGKNVMRFKLTSQWNTDGTHTKEETWIEIPIVKADVELYDIKLIDENGYYLDPTDLDVGQKVTVQYFYRNNTDCTVYVEGYNDDKSKIDGVYEIPANNSICVNGSSFFVPNRRNFTVWGGVYLEGAGLYNTANESDGTNNTMVLNCKSNHPLTLTPIVPNASYREDTNVITSYWLKNKSSDDYTQSQNITVRFRVYDYRGRLLITKTKTQAVVPANDKNLVYFKWKVPKGILLNRVTIKADILDGGVYYNLVSRQYSTVKYTKYVTPDTQFEKAAPSGYTIPPEPQTSSSYAAWWEYSCSDGVFTKQNYGMGIYTGGTNKITPATGASAVQNGSDWTMKSGYGITLNSYRMLLMIYGYSFPDSNAYTPAQYAVALFPEYNYSLSSGKCRTLGLSGYYWQFPENADYGRTHFTPLWYPDGKYTVKVVQSDVWTPSGMISANIATNGISIKDSAYDDWFVGRQ